MTNEQAIKILKDLQIDFNENWLDYSGVNEAFNLAFEALESQALIEIPQGDLISRSALIEEVQDWVDPFVLTFINNAPPVEPDMEFAKWVTKMIFDNEVEDFDFEMFSELACRKLEKIGLVKKTESEWIKRGCEEK